MSASSFFRGCFPALGVMLFATSGAYAQKLDVSPLFLNSVVDCEVYFLSHDRSPKITYDIPADQKERYARGDQAGDYWSEASKRVAEFCAAQPDPNEKPNLTWEQRRLISQGRQIINVIFASNDGRFEFAWNLKSDARLPNYPVTNKFYDEAQLALQHKQKLADIASADQRKREEADAKRMAQEAAVAKQKQEVGDFLHDAALRQRKISTSEPIDSFVTAYEIAADRYRFRPREGSKPFGVRAKFFRLVCTDKTKAPGAFDCPDDKIEAVFFSGDFPIYVKARNSGTLIDRFRVPHEDVYLFLNVSNVEDTSAAENPVSAFVGIAAEELSRLFGRIPTAKIDAQYVASYSCRTNDCQDIFRTDM